MDLAAIIGILQVVVQELPGALTTAQQLFSLGEKIGANLKGTALTDDERKALRAQIETDVQLAMEPLPPAQPGDPDFGTS